MPKSPSYRPCDWRGSPMDCEALGWPNTPEPCWGEVEYDEISTGDNDYYESFRCRGHAVGGTYTPEEYVTGQSVDIPSIEAVRNGWPYPRK